MYGAVKGQAAGHTWWQAAGADIDAQRQNRDAFGDGGGDGRLRGRSKEAKEVGPAGMQVFGLLVE